MFQKTQQSQFYFSTDHGCDVIVKKKKLENQYFPCFDPY